LGTISDKKTKGIIQNGPYWLKGYSPPSIKAVLVSLIVERIKPSWCSSKLINGRGNHIASRVAIMLF
jgi:hypothetical protein